MANEKTLKAQMNMVCCAVLLFFAVLLAVRLVLSFLFAFSESEDGGIIQGTADALSYAVSYFISAAIFRRVFASGVLPMRLSPNFTPHTFAVLSVCAALLLAVSHFSSFLLGGASAEVPETEIYRGVDIILLFLSTVIIPAFCEELLFRGIVTNNLLPFGKTFAIVASGVVFGLAHGNHDQFLFASVAGIVLGWLYAETGSVWSGIFLHLFNNLLSVSETLILGVFPAERAYFICVSIELFIMLCGVLSLVYLLLIQKREKRGETAGGSFGRILPSFRGRERHLKAEEYIKGFFSPVMIVFLAYTAISEVLYVLLF
ncbi:MAG: lysostaphin resistance A-like protein [Eubacteriales bacterium]